MVALPFRKISFVTSSTSPNLLTELHRGAIIRVKFGEVMRKLYSQNFTLSIGLDEVFKGR